MPADRLSGLTIGPYYVRDLVGVGGVAEVYRAVHRDGSHAALKVLKVERLGERDKIRAFEIEIAQLKRLSHPALPKVLHDGSIDNRPAFLMDFMRGETLSALVTAHEPLPGATLVREIVGIAGYLHGKDLVHNDLKLENLILRPDGSVALVDFGNVREIRNRVITRFFLRRQEQIFGTATYLAPELIRGDAPTTQSDVYALGVIAFMLLTGKPPFDDARQSGRLRAHLNEKPPSIQSLLPQLPPAVASVIDLCLVQADPERRPSDAARSWRPRSGPGRSGIRSNPRPASRSRPCLPELAWPGPLRPAPAHGHGGRPGADAGRSGTLPSAAWLLRLSGVLIDTPAPTVNSLLCARPKPSTRLSAKRLAGSASRSYRNARWAAGRHGHQLHHRRRRGREYHHHRRAERLRMYLGSHQYRRRDPGRRSSFQPDRDDG